MSVRNCLRTALFASLLIWASPSPAAEFEDYDFSRWSVDVTECDLLASHGRDPGHIAPPVSSSEMDKPAAIQACLRAVEQDPDNPRLNYQLGRAYGYSGLGDKAMPYRLKAVAADYPQSLFVIGYLYLTGQTIEQDSCKTINLWQRGARYQRLAALVALPRHYLAGDFEDCGVVLSNSDLRAYLDRAAELSSDYYVRMLVDVLRKDVEAREASATP